MSLSVIVPVLNEEARMGALLLDLSRSHCYEQIIVVDGGSTDRTLEIVSNYPEVVLVKSRPGRAVQCNSGAEEATGDVFLFVHADTQLPWDARNQIFEALSRPDTVGGAFRTQTVCDQHPVPNRWFLPFLPITDLGSRVRRYPYGDQGIFVRAPVFRQLNGFPDLPIMEDVSFSKQLRRVGRIARARGPIRVSGRRFLNRPIKTTVIVNVFPMLHRLGVKPVRLASFYEQIR